MSLGGLFSLFQSNYPAFLWSTMSRSAPWTLLKLLNGHSRAIGLFSTHLLLDISIAQRHFCYLFLYFALDCKDRVGQKGVLHANSRGQGYYSLYIPQTRRYRPVSGTREKFRRSYDFFHSEPKLRGQRGHEKRHAMP